MIVVQLSNVSAIEVAIFWFVWWWLWSERAGSCIIRSIQAVVRTAKYIVSFQKNANQSKTIQNVFSQK